MAAVSAWSKPGAWALDAETPDAAADDFPSLAAPAPPAADFPSLAAAAATKSKKKKPQTLTLAQFTTVSVASEPIALPTGPRERTAEELARGPRGFNSYGGERRRGFGDDAGNPNPRGPPRDSEFTPSRADEADDWGSGKRSVAPERRRERGTVGLFDSSSRADELDSWVTNKSVAPPRSGFDGSRERRSGFDFRKDGANGSGADSDTWGRRRDSVGGSGTNLDSWKKDEPVSATSRPRLVLQPRSLPLSNVEEEKAVVAKEVKSVSSNPFGAARPREEVLKEKGQDWKEIDEKLEAMKVREAPLPAGKKSFVNGTGREDRTATAWRKPDVSLLGEYKAEETAAEN